MASDRERFARMMAGEWDTTASEGAMPSLTDRHSTFAQTALRSVSEMFGLGAPVNASWEQRDSGLYVRGSFVAPHGDRCTHLACMFVRARFREHRHEH